MKTIKGDLIKLAKEGQFDVVIHGCNCFHTMGAGIAAAILKEAHDYYGEYSWIESHEDVVVSVLRRAFHTYENLKNLNTISLYETLQSEETNKLLHDIIDIKRAMWY